jgi:hypothetical protein
LGRCETRPHSERARRGTVTVPCLCAAESTQPSREFRRISLSLYSARQLLGRLTRARPAGNARPPLRQKQSAPPRRPGRRGPIAYARGHRHIPRALLACIRDIVIPVQLVPEGIGQIRQAQFQKGQCLRHLRIIARRTATERLPRRSRVTRSPRLTAASFSARSRSTPQWVVSPLSAPRRVA